MDLKFKTAPAHWATRASYDAYTPEVVSKLYIQTSQWSVLIAEFVIIFLMFVMNEIG